MPLFGIDLVSFLEAMLEICPNNSIKNQFFFFFFFLYMLKNSQQVFGIVVVDRNKNGF